MTSKIGCVQHDCDKCKAQAAELEAAKASAANWMFTAAQLQAKLDAIQTQEPVKSAMSILDFYIVRRKDNAVFLPERTCSSHFEFTHQPKYLTPRLFMNKHAAQCSINAWGAGIWGRETYTESEGWEHPSYTVEGEPMPTGKGKRDKSLLEAVHIVLSF
jgi:hypothetical protein